MEDLLKDSDSVPEDDGYDMDSDGSEEKGGACFWCGARDGLSWIGDRLRSVFQRTSENVNGAAHRLRETNVSEFKDRAVTYSKENPAKVGAAGAAVVVGIAALVYLLNRGRKR